MIGIWLSSILFAVVGVAMLIAPDRAVAISKRRDRPVNEGQVRSAVYLGAGLFLLISAAGFAALVLE